jgi:branched-chain amino acid transport system permease protein
VLGTDRVVYRFYRAQKAKPIIFVIASIGVMFILNGIVRFIIGVDDQRFSPTASASSSRPAPSAR